jgi:hypothetical protein
VAPPSISNLDLGLLVPIPTLVLVVGVLGKIFAPPPVPVLICALIEIVVKRNITENNDWIDFFIFKNLKMKNKTNMLNNSNQIQPSKILLFFNFKNSFQSSANSSNLNNQQINK